MTKDVISLSISVLLLFRHYISHKITFGAPSSGGVLCSACGAFISWQIIDINKNFILSHNVFETRGFKTNSHLLYACFEKKDTI